jgi:hypothetical protein
METLKSKVICFLAASKLPTVTNGKTKQESEATIMLQCVNSNSLSVKFVLEINIRVETE